MNIGLYVCVFLPIHDLGDVSYRKYMTLVLYNSVSSIVMEVYKIWH